MLAPPAGQPWQSSVPQSAAAVTSVQQAGVQSSGTASSDTVSVVPILFVTACLYCFISSF